MIDWENKNLFLWYLGFALAGVLLPLFDVLGGGDASNWTGWLYMVLTGLMIVSVFYPERFEKFSQMTIKEREFGILPENREAAIIFTLLLLVTGMLVAETSNVINNGIPQGEEFDFDVRNGEDVLVTGNCEPSGSNVAGYIAFSCDYKGNLTASQISFLWENKRTGNSYMKSPIQVDQKLRELMELTLDKKSFKILAPYEPGPYVVTAVANGSELRAKGSSTQNNIDVHYVLTEETEVNQEYKETNQVFNLAVLLTLVITGLNLVHRLNKGEARSSAGYQSLAVYWLKIFFVPISMAIVIALFLSTVI